MIKTVIGSFDSYDEAREVVRDLKDEGFMESDISIVASDQKGGDSSAERTPNDLDLDPALTSDTSRETSGTRAMRANTTDVDDTADKATGDATGAATGAVTGGVLGGAAGVAVSLMGLAIPGIGPIIAAGPIVAGLTGAGVGAVAGGLIGGLTHLGVSEEHAEYYAESVRRGGALVTIRCDESRAERAAQIMQDHGAVDIERRVERWRDTGWTGSDRTAVASTGEMVTDDADLDRTTSGFGSQGVTAGTTSGLGLGSGGDESPDRGSRGSGVGTTAGTMGASSLGTGGSSGLGSSGGLAGTSAGGTMSSGSGSTASPGLGSSGSSSGMRSSGSSSGMGSSGSSSGMGSSGSSSGMGSSGSSSGMGSSGSSSGLGGSGSSGLGGSGSSSGMGTSSSSGLGSSGTSGLGASGSSGESALTGGTGRTRAQSDWNSIQDDFRRDHERTHAGQESFDDYAPAYRHGYESAQSDTHRGRSWDDVEPTLRNDWERRNPDSTWERMKDAVRRGWDRLTGDDTNASSGSRDSALGSASIDRNRG